MSTEFPQPRESVQSKVFFTPDQMDEMRKNHTDELIELDNIEEEIKALKERHAPRIKEIKCSAKDTRGLLKRKYHYVQRECFLEPDYTDGVMNYVDCENAEVLQTRKLKPEEKQLTLSVRTA